MPEYVIGVDGGNSKTDVVVATTTGRLLARHRGPGVNSPLADPAAWRQRLTDLVDEARDMAGVPARGRARCAVYFLANVDLPAERRVARRELVRADRAELTVVQNDTVGILRAGVPAGTFHHMKVSSLHAFIVGRSRHHIRHRPLALRLHLPQFERGSAGAHADASFGHLQGAGRKVQVGR